MYKYPYEEELKKLTIIGIGRTAFSRLGPEKFLPNYKIVCLEKSDEDDQIEKEVEIKNIIQEKKKYRSTILNILDNQEALNFIRAQKNPVLYLYFVNKSVERFLHKNKIKYVGSRNSQFGYLGSKIKFYYLLDELGIKTPKYKILKKEEMDYINLRNELGEFVIQRETRGGGQGTVFVFNKNDFQKAKNKFKSLSPTEELRATQYISGLSPSVTMCLTQSGVIRSPLQHQILSPKKAMNQNLGRGRFAGHDWSSYDFDEKIEKQADEISEKLGLFLRNEYQGILGIDFILDEKEKILYPLECNPRLLGSFPVFAMIQERMNEPQILYYHFLSSLFPREDFALQNINKKIQRRKKGAQIIFYNKKDTEFEIKQSLDDGIYKLENNKLKFLRPGYKLWELKNDEFIITDGVFQKGIILRKYKKIGRILTIDKVLGQKRKELNFWAIKILDLIYKYLEGG